MSDFFSNIGDYLYNFIQFLLDACLSAGTFIFNLLFGWVNIPPFPEELKGIIDFFLDLIFDNISLLGFFVRLETLSKILPLLVFIFNFKIIYHFVRWIIKKIPFINIS